MIGPLTVGKKAAKAGYKRYGWKGAIASGLVGVGGYVLAKRLLAKLASGIAIDDEAESEGASTDDGGESATLDA